MINLFEEKTVMTDVVSHDELATANLLAIVIAVVIILVAPQKAS
jgi:hypothetical protein